MTIIFAAFLIAGTLGYAIHDAAQVIADAIDGIVIQDDEEEEPEPWEP